MIKIKDILDGAKQFASAGLSLKAGATQTLYGLDLSPTAKTVAEARKRVTTAMDKAEVKTNIEQGIFSSYSEKNSDKDLSLALVGSTFVSTVGNDKLKPTLELSVKQCLNMVKTVYSNLDKPKAHVHTHGKAGESLKAFVKPIRDAGLGFKRQTVSRLLSEVTSQYLKACGLKVEPDTSNPAIVRSIKTSVKTISTKLEALKDIETLKIINSIPSKYLS
tara:strand:+ start:1573 stop:2229 length:657 start_codon:yes stop_codon:yes gene_type:complete